MGVFEPEPWRSGSATRKGLFKPNTELMSAHNSFCSLDEWARGPAGTAHWATWTSDFTSLDLRAGEGCTAGQVRLQGPAVQALGRARQEGPPLLSFFGVGFSHETPAHSAPQGRLEGARHS